MSDQELPPDLPRTGGVHRRTRGGQRSASLLLSLLGVAIVAALVFFVLHKRGEPARSEVRAPASTAASTSSAQVASSPAVASSAPSSPSGPATASATSSSAATSSATAAPTTQTAAALPALDVLNDSRISGLAARAAAEFRAAGWLVASTGNFKGDQVPATTVFYPAGEQSAAAKLAAAFHIRSVLAATRGMSGVHLTVVLARDWADSSARG